MLNESDQTQGDGEKRQTKANDEIRWKNIGKVTGDGCEDTLIGRERKEERKRESRRRKEEREKGEKRETRPRQDKETPGVGSPQQKIDEPLHDMRQRHNS